MVVKAEQKRRGRHQASRAGFTVVELVITLALLLVVGSLALMTFQVANNSRRQALARIDVAEKSRSSLELISRELRSAFLNPVGRIPLPEGYQPDVAYEDWTTPVDDNNNGLINEAALAFIGLNRSRTLENRQGSLIEVGDGLDNDGDGSLGAGIEQVEIGNITMLRGPTGSPGIDEEQFNGIDDDGDGLIDEDVVYPSDMLNFVIAEDTAAGFLLPLDTAGGASAARPGYDLVEIGYALDPEANRLRRRIQTAPDPTQSLSGGIDGRYLVRRGGGLDAGNETDFKVDSEIFAFDIVGLDFRYYYYDYQVAAVLNDPEAWGLSPGVSVFDVVLSVLPGAARAIAAPDGRIQAVQVAGLDVVYPHRDDPWAFRQEWRSDRRDTAPGYDGLALAVQNYYALFYNINNEPSDAIPAVSDLDSLKRMSDRRRRETDGLPGMVEITLFATDSRGILSLPTQYSTRVYLAHR